MTPDMLPIITKVKGLWINSGAGHLGWTMGMALAEKITNGIFKS
jgi:glycine/D-amino acid oxidase-like deaminating enzyme